MSVKHIGLPGSVNKAHRVPGSVSPGVPLKHIEPPSQIQTSWNLEIFIFKIMKSGFDYTNLEQINYRKLLNLSLNKIII